MRAISAGSAQESNPNKIFPEGSVKAKPGFCEIVYGTKKAWHVLSDLIDEVDLDGVDKEKIFHVDSNEVGVYVGSRGVRCIRGGHLIPVQDTLHRRVGVGYRCQHDGMVACINSRQH